MNKLAGGSAVFAEGVSKAYSSGGRDTEVLKGVDFRAAFGELTMIVGPSGSGKSTLMALISGLLRPDAGRVRALDISLWELASKDIDRFRLDNCGFIFQGFNLFPALNALDQVALILRYMGVKDTDSKDRARDTLSQVGLRDKLSLRPSEMSGGEKQRVAIARALVKEPRLIFADEPTSALDSENAGMIIELLSSAARERNAAIVVVTHDIKLRQSADLVVEMEDGRVLHAR
jgi:putative ABC transport system ATP-binding protein